MASMLVSAKRLLLPKLAIRNILRNRRRSVLTLLSMGGGYALLSFMLSMSEGSYNNMIDLFTRDHTGHVQIHHGNYLQRPSLYKTLRNTNKLIEQIKNMSEVKGVAPRIFGPALAYGKEKTYPANVIGIAPELEASTTLLKNKLVRGTYLTDGMTANGAFPAMMGFSLAKNLHLSVGDELVLISQGIDGSIANDVFEVTAIVGTQDSYERMNVYLSLTAMRQFLSMAEDEVHELAISLKHQTLAQTFSQQLITELKQAELSIAPWQVIEQSFYNSMQADKKGNYVSMTVLIFIVSIGVLNTILMAILERTREFGVLRAVGTRPTFIFRLIMMESLLLSLTSCILGLFIAFPANYWLTHSGITMPTPLDMGGIAFDKLLGEISWFVMGVPALVIITSTLVISIFPAWRAARISPLQALRAI